MTSLFSSTPHPSSTLAYPLLNQMLDSLLSAPVFLQLRLLSLSLHSLSLQLLCLQTRYLLLRPDHPFRQCFPIQNTLQFLRLFHSCHMTLLLLQSIFSKSPQFVSKLAISNNVSPATRNVQFTPGEAGSATKNVVHTVVNEKKVNQYIKALKGYEQ